MTETLSVSPQMYSTTFEMAWKDLIEDEGGRANHPKDPGGETYMGITKAWLARVAPRIKFEDLTPEIVKGLYWQFWWKEYGLALLDSPVTGQLFSILVLCGPDAAFRLVQLALQSMSVKDVEVDGVLGPMTRAQINQVDGSTLLCAFRAASAVYLLTKDGSLRKMGTFDKGWLARAMR